MSKNNISKRKYSQSAPVAPLTLVPRKAAIPWHRKVVMVLVGLPARGKSYIAHKVVGFLRWRGLKADLFNVGMFRRDVVQDVPQDAKFFSVDNREAKQLREKLAYDVLDHLLNWLEQGGDVGVFDATNTTKERRAAVLERCMKRSAHLSVLFVESFCDDPQVLESNLRVKCQNSPDYKGMPLEAALDDLKKRIQEYERVYQPIDSASASDLTSYIKLINLQSKVICNKVRGRFGLLIAGYLMCIHIRPRPIYLVRAGHCEGVPEEEETKEGEGEQDGSVGEQVEAATQTTPAKPPNALTPNSGGSSGDSNGNGLTISIEAADASAGKKKDDIQLVEAGVGVGLEAQQMEVKSAGPNDSLTNSLTAPGDNKRERRPISRARSMPEIPNASTFFKIPNTLSASANLSASGVRFAERLAEFIITKVENYAASQSALATPEAAASPVQRSMNATLPSGQVQQQGQQVPEITLPPKAVDVKDPSLAVLAPTQQPLTQAVGTNASLKQEPSPTASASRSVPPGSPAVKPGEPVLGRRETSKP